jgi:hypothetical protein
MFMWVKFNLVCICTGRKSAVQMGHSIVHMMITVSSLRTVGRSFDGKQQS